MESSILHNGWTTSWHLLIRNTSKFIPYKFLPFLAIVYTKDNMHIATCMILFYSEKEFSYSF